MSGAENGGVGRLATRDRIGGERRAGEAQADRGAEEE
jgi:hypothetical protein